MSEWASTRYRVPVAAAMAARARQGVNRTAREIEPTLERVSSGQTPAPIRAARPANRFSGLGGRRWRGTAELRRCCLEVPSTHASLEDRAYGEANKDGNARSGGRRSVYLPRSLGVPIWAVKRECRGRAARHNR